MVIVFTPVLCKTFFFFENGKEILLCFWVKRCANGALMLEELDEDILPRYEAAAQPRL